MALNRDKLSVQTTDLCAMFAVLNNGEQHTLLSLQGTIPMYVNSLKYNCPMVRFSKREIESSRTRMQLHINPRSLRKLLLLLMHRSLFDSCDRFLKNLQTGDHNKALQLYQADTLTCPSQCLVSRSSGCTWTIQIVLQRHTWPLHSRFSSRHVVVYGFPSGHVYI